MEDQTSKEPRKTGAPVRMNGAKDGVPFGIGQPDPSPEQKKAGWAKKKRGQELAKAVLELAFKGMKDSQLKKAAAEYFNVPEEEITVETMLLFRQAEKAIQKADTYAFNSVMDRAHGKPKEKVEHTGKNGSDLFADKSDSELKNILHQIMKKLDDQ